MFRSARALWLLPAIAAWLAGCGGGDGPTAPSAPGGGIVGGRAGGSGGGRPGGSGGGTGDKDGGLTDAGGTGGAPDAGAFAVIGTECDNVSPADPLDVGPNGKLPNAVAVPVDLEVTRVETTWTGDCVAPVIRVTLSDGDCPSGDGHEVEVSIDAPAVADGTVRRGQNPLEPEPVAGGIRMRYRRPASLDPATAGEWGTCAGVTGNVDFTQTPGTDGGAELRVRLQTQLAACDDVTVGVQVVNGSFDVTLIRGLDDLCPP